MATFISAGSDATSNFLQSMLFFIKKHPQVEARLRKDIDEIFKTDEDINAANLKKLYYVDWIQKEATRFYGPGTGIATRIAVKDHYLGPIPIKKGTGIAVHPLSIHHSQKYYKNPYEFRPERWEN